MLDTWEFRAILEKGKALNPLKFKASEMAPPVGLEPTTLSVRNIVALLAWGARNARCFFLLRAPLHLPQAARCSEPVNSRCGCVWQGRRFGSASKVKKSRKTGVSLLFLAPPVGLEPTTLRLTVVVTRISNSVIRFHAV